MCLHEQMCVCFLNQSPVCAVPSSPDDGFECLCHFSYMHAFVHSAYVFVVLSSPDDGFVVFQFFIHACLRALVIRERACACTSRCVYVCCINNKFVLFHLAQMMDLCVFYNCSYMHAFVHSSYVSERVLARADVCMFAESITCLCCSI